MLLSTTSVFLSLPEENTHTNYPALHVSHVCTLSDTTITVLVKVLKGKVNNMLTTTSFCATVAYLNSISTILIFKKIKQES